MQGQSSNLHSHVALAAIPTLSTCCAWHRLQLAHVLASIGHCARFGDRMRPAGRRRLSSRARRVETRRPSCSALGNALGRYICFVEGMQGDEGPYWLRLAGEERLDKELGALRRSVKAGKLPGVTKASPFTRKDQPLLRLKTLASLGKRAGAPVRRRPACALAVHAPCGHRCFAAFTVRRSNKSAVSHALLASAACAIIFRESPLSTFLGGKRSQPGLDNTAVLPPTRCPCRTTTCAAGASKWSGLTPSLRQVWPPEWPTRGSPTHAFRPAPAPLLASMAAQTSWVAAWVRHAVHTVLRKAAVSTMGAVPDAR